MNSLFLSFALAPFIYYASIDNLYHFRLRRVSLTEHLLHLLLFFILIGSIRGAYQGKMTPWLFGIALYALVGSLDEFIFHRNLPQKESEVHAKEHWSFFIFVVAVYVNYHWSSLKAVYQSL
jgi:hypothetical protein